jgi:hypothetical protein
VGVVFDWWFAPAFGGEFEFAIAPAIIAAGIGAAGALASAAMSANGQGQGATPRFTITNPALFDLANIFGAEAIPGRRGGIFQTGTSAFEGLPDSIRDFAFNPLPLSGLEQGARSLAESVLGFAPEITQQLRGLVPGALDLANTGFRTPIQPAVDFATNVFREDLLPQLLERAGGGLASSSFLDSSMEQARRLAIELGVQDIGLQESASARRVQGLPLAANLIGASAALPINIAGDLARLGSSFRSQEEEQRSRALNVFAQLAGLGQSPGLQILTGGFPTTDSTAGTLGALAEGVPAIVNSFAGFRTGQPTQQSAGPGTPGQVPFSNTEPFNGGSNPLAPNNLFSMFS